MLPAVEQQVVDITVRRGDVLPAVVVVVDEPVEPAVFVEVRDADPRALTERILEPRVRRDVLKPTAAKVVIEAVRLRLVPRTPRRLTTSFGTRIRQAILPGI